MLIIIRVWLVLCGGAMSAFVLARLMAWYVLWMQFSPIKTLVVCAISVPLAAIVLFCVFRWLLFKAADCEI